MTTDVSDIAPPETDLTPCKYCGLPLCVHERCLKCGYTACDCKVHGDHNLCGEPDPELMIFDPETELTPSPANE